MAGGHGTPKEFEEAVAGELRDSCKVELIVPQGSCINCQRRGNRCCNRRFCPDIYASYEGSTFVLDCKNYAERTYLDRSNINKIIRDRDETESDVGIIVLSRGRVTEEDRQYLEEMEIILIEVKYKQSHWKGNLVGKFRECFQEE